MFLYGITYLPVFPSSAAAASEPRESRHTAATSAKNIVRKSFMAIFFLKKVFPFIPVHPFDENQLCSPLQSWLPIVVALGGPRAKLKVTAAATEPSATSTNTTITVREGGCVLSSFSSFHTYSSLRFSP